MSTSPYRLLGAAVSYYTAKIHAFLIHKRVPWIEVLATRAVFKEEILPRVGWPVIPVLIAPDGTTLQDTSDMVDYLEARHPTPCLVPRTPVRRFASLLFELYADEWIKMPALHYRWNYDHEFAVMEFGRNNDPDRTPAEQRRTGEKIARQFSGWLAPLGITPATIPAIEAEYLGLLVDLERHFAALPFLLGDSPSLADCALYGPLHAHLCRDPNSGFILRRHAPRVVTWLERMTETTAGECDGHDELPNTLLPVLQRLSRDYVPVLLTQTAAFQTWLATHNEDIPRLFGTQAFVVGRGTSFAATGTRACFSYDQWMLQRALQVYADSTAESKARIRRTATTFGAAALLDLDLQYRVARQHFQLVRAP